MSRRARFRVVGLLDNTGRPMEGTVTIDRDAGIMEVRPLRRRRTYRLPLGTVATMLCQLIVKAEDRERRRLKKKRRRSSRR